MTAQHASPAAPSGMLTPAPFLLQLPIARCLILNQRLILIDLGGASPREPVDHRRWPHGIDGLKSKRSQLLHLSSQGVQELTIEDRALEQVGEKRTRSNFTYKSQNGQEPRLSLLSNSQTLVGKLESLLCPDQKWHWVRRAYSYHRSFQDP